MCLSPELYWNQNISEYVKKDNIDVTQNVRHHLSRTWLARVSGRDPSSVNVTMFYSENSSRIKSKIFVYKQEC